MTNNAEFTIARLEIKVKNLKKQVAEKQNALNDALNQVKDITIENEKLKSKLKKHETPAEHYDYSWSWISKIVFLVKEANKPLRSAEIIEVLQKKEPVLHEKVSKEKFLSAFLNMSM
jgi:regulator of replication initiation timing